MGVTTLAAKKKGFVTTLSTYNPSPSVLQNSLASRQVGFRSASVITDLDPTGLIVRIQIPIGFKLPIRADPDPQQG